MLVNKTFPDNPIGVSTICPLISFRIDLLTCACLVVEPAYLRADVVGEVLASDTVAFSFLPVVQELGCACSHFLLCARVVGRIVIDAEELLVLETC